MESAQLSFAAATSLYHTCSDTSHAAPGFLHDRRAFPACMHMSFAFSSSCLACCYAYSMEDGTKGTQQEGKGGRKPPALPGTYEQNSGRKKEGGGSLPALPACLAIHFATYHAYAKRWGGAGLHASVTHLFLCREVKGSGRREACPGKEAASDSPLPRDTHIQAA